MSGPSRLILPDNVRQQVEQQKTVTPPPKVSIPPEMRAAVKESLGIAQEIEEKLSEIVDKGEPAFITLLSQPSIQKLVQKYMAGLLPQLIHNTAGRDRQQLLNTMVQIQTERQSTIDPTKNLTYQNCVEDLKAVLNQIPPPQSNITISVPAFDLENLES